MVNPLQETPVQLAGRGVVHRPFGKFQPGEYEVLDNLEITPDGTIINRRGFSFSVQEVAGSFYSNATRFIGSYGPYPIISDYSNNLYLTYNNGSTIEYLPGTTTKKIGITYFDQTVFFNAVRAALPALPGGAAVKKHELIDGFWNYNNYNHFLFTYIDQDNLGNSRKAIGVYRVQNRFDLNKSPVDNYIEHASEDGTPAVITFLTAVSIPVAGGGSYSNVDIDLYPYPQYSVLNFLIHKERSWVAGIDTVYFSSAGDHSVWSAPDGGFIKFPGDTIKQIYALGDIIYVFTDSRIYAVTYNTDFNTDGEVTLISPEVGADTVCSVGDTIYMVKGNGLYQISGNNVSRVMDLAIGLEFDAFNTRQSVSTLGMTVSSKIGSFDNELYIFMYTVRSQMIAGFGASFFPGNVYNEKHISTDIFTTDLFKLNLETGSVSRVNLDPGFKKLNNNFAGISLSNHLSPIDCFFVPIEDQENEARLYFLFKAETSATSGFSIGFPTFGDPSVPYYGVDFLVSPYSGFPYTEVWGVIPNYRLKIKDFSPDGFKYYMKKFRSCLLEANLPRVWSADPYPSAGHTVQTPSIKLYFGDQSNPSVNKVLSEPATDLYDDSRGFRIACNQRSRFIGIELELGAQVFDVDWWDDNPTNERLFELNDLRFVWTPIQRSIVNNTSLNT